MEEVSGKRQQHGVTCFNGGVGPQAHLSAVAVPRLRGTDMAVKQEAAPSHEKKAYRCPVRSVRDVRDEIDLRCICIWETPIKGKREDSYALAQLFSRWRAGGGGRTSVAS